MIATVPFVQKTFDRFNALCFGGALPPVPIVLSRARTFLGRMEFKTRRNFFRSGVSYLDYRMKISTHFDLPEEELEDVVIHEMIHYYIAFSQIKDTSAHGKVFRGMMDDINRKFGRHLTVSHRSADVHREDVIREHFLCISTFKDGNIGITACSPAMIPQMRKWLPRYFSLARMEWYVSRDPFFNRFPRSRTPKIYRITPEELSAHSLEQMKSEGRSLR